VFLRLLTMTHDRILTETKAGAAGELLSKRTMKQNRTLK